MSSIGDSVGSSPANVSPEQMQKTAATLVAKAGMRMVPDTVDLNFFLLDDGVRKYQAPASRPNLTSPLGSVRMATSYDSQVDQRWHAVYDALVKDLPSDVAQLLTVALQMPQEQRGANLAVLDSFLQSTAKSLVLLSVASAPTDQESLTAMRADGNLLSPYIALSGALQSDNTLLKATLALLSTVGPNYPQFNAISGYMSEFNAIAMDMATAGKTLQDPKTTQDGQAKFGQVASDLADLSSRFDSHYGGGDLMLLGALMHASEIVTSAISLDKGGAAPLLISLFIASQSFASSNSETHGVGPHLSSALNGLNAAMLSAFASDSDNATKLVFEQVVTVALTSAVLYGALTYHQGVDIKGSDSNPEVRSEKNFAYSLMLTLLSKSGVISTISNGLAATTNLPDIKKNAVGAWLTTATTLLLISAAAKGHDRDSLEPLIDDNKAPLLKGFDEISAFVAEGLQNGTIRGANWEHTHVYMQQAIIALSHGDSMAFLDSVDSILALGGTSYSDILKDISKLTEYAKSSISSLQVSADEMSSNCTSIYSPA